MTMNDCISRQAVHYYIESHINEIITESGVDKNEHTNRMLRALVNGVDTMPSVTPKVIEDIKADLRMIDASMVYKVWTCEEIIRFIDKHIGEKNETCD